MLKEIIFYNDVVLIHTNLYLYKLYYQKKKNNGFLLWQIIEKTCLVQCSTRHIGMTFDWLPN